jgi:initiation factor 1A
MPGKKKGKSSKNKARGKTGQFAKRDLTLKEEGQEYAQVLRMLGNLRVETMCFDGKTRLAHICGKMRKRVWIAQDDIVLLTLRDFQDDKADIILKYSVDEARQLKSMGEIPESTKIGEAVALDGEDDEEDTFVFDDI